ncbi:MAG: alpha/beta hydrolase, partial [Planctomycetales bacterium]
SFIFLPSRYPDGDWKRHGLAVEDAEFEAEDGTRLHGWYYPREDAAAVVLYAHGNAGNIAWRTDILRDLHGQAKVSVLMFDYRGYGRSEGSPNEHGVLQDARAARKWLAAKVGIPEREIVLMGRSLGGGVAVDLAARDGARALVLESTFTSVPDVAARVYPFIPVRLLMRTRLDSLAKISDFHGPLFQSHGDADALIPVEFGERLFNAANEPKTFFTIKGGDHNAPQPSRYYQELREFLETLDEDGS